MVRFLPFDNGKRHPPMKNTFTHVKAILLIGLFSLSISTRAQKFITPFEAGAVPSLDCYIIKEDGERVEGRTRSIFVTGRGIRYVTLRLPSGEKVKFLATEMRELAFKNNGLTKVISTAEQSASLRKASDANWDQIYGQDYILYEKVKLPSGKFVMMQMINPGFDSRIKVYYSLGSRKTSGVGIPGPGIAPVTIKITGGRQRAYWVSKDNGAVFKIKRGSYNKKKFTRLFGDSPQMLETYGRPYRFSEFSEHVYMYDKLNKK